MRPTLSTPDVIERRLSNGLTVLIEPLPFVRSASLGFLIRSGSSSETVDVAGATHFIEHLLFKGTKTRSTSDIARAIDALGGEVDAYTHKEYTAIHAHVLDEHADEALELLTDLMTQARWSDDDLEMERSVILEEIRMVEDTPDDLIHEIFLENFWPDHPLGRPILGPAETISALSRETIEHHISRVLIPQNVIFCASGNVDPERILGSLEKKFEQGAGEPPRAPVQPPLPRQHLVLRTKPELEQVHLSLGSRGFPQSSEKRYGAALFSTILGGGMSSRLFQRVREQEGLVYSISSYHTANASAGFESVYAACNPDKVGRVVELVLEEMKRLRVHGVSAAELEAAKRNVKGSILLSLESTVSRMSAISRQWHYFERIFTPDEVIDAINSVTVDDLVEIIEATIDRETISLTLLGPLEEPGIAVEDLRAAL
ncbi:MAG: pitrilysin family protein [Thermoanaerobaculia bacterium]|nr:pitrilysin family protein [Thermoanaerobaculia bacterium]